MSCSRSEFRAYFVHLNFLKLSGEDCCFRFSGVRIAPNDYPGHPERVRAKKWKEGRGVDKQRTNEYMASRLPSWR